MPLARVEVARGEQSALYGSDAIGGVIDVTTGGAGLGAAIEAGSFQTLRGRAHYSHEIDGAVFGGAVTGFTTEGIDTSGQGSEEDGSESLTGLFRTRIDIGPDWQLSGLALLNGSTVETDADTDFDSIPDDTIRETETDQTVAGVSLNGPGFGLDHAVRASYTKVERENTANGTYANRTTGERLKASWSPSKSWEGEGVDHRLTGLVEIESEDYERDDTDTLYGDPNQEQDFDSFGLAAEYRVTVGALSVNASARHDDNDGQFEDATTWRLGAVYRLGTFGRVRISGGEGVKNPTFTELFGFYPGQFVGNPDLEPERSRSVEIGWDKEFEKGAVSVAAFHADLEDEIYTAYDANFNSTALNRENDSERERLEVSGHWQVHPQVTLYGAASSITSEDDAGEDEIRVPEWTASLSGRWESARVPGFTLGAALDAVGEQDDKDFGSYPSRRVTLDSYVLASATARYPLTEHIDVTLRGEDLFDEEPVDVYGFRSKGRGVYLGLAWK